MPKSKADQAARDWVLKWKPAIDQEFTLNVDGSTKNNSKQVWGGGVICSNSVEWLGGFACRTMPTNIEEIEVKTIRIGIQWAWERAVRDHEVQSDAAEVYKWVKGLTSLSGMVNHGLFSQE
ncbi:unnamed protein product [Cuscuta campestris]|uniref:RNase H type-1 domain-containing protein n=1 Tax=Cuscuta campestris TaxID=132261 RepID=A0A484L3U1_9ASTE|nr:unnamed protein product [Cuscuta campestris]